MDIDDPIEVAAKQLAKEGDHFVPNDVVLAIIAAIPFAGGGISSLLAGVAQRRVVERAGEMFSAMRERLEQLDEAKVDRKFFESEEFQTLLTLALEQLQTIHEREKIHMLASALANSGVENSATSTRKELFVRALRDLTTSHIRWLKELLTSSETIGKGVPRFHSQEICGPTGELLMILQTLSGQGLVEEFPKRKGLVQRYGIEPSRDEIARELFEGVPSRCFRLSALGHEFLLFIGGAVPGYRKPAPGYPKK